MPSDSSIFEAAHFADRIKKWCYRTDHLSFSCNRFCKTCKSPYKGPTGMKHMHSPVHCSCPSRQAHSSAVKSYFPLANFQWLNRSRTDIVLPPLGSLRSLLSINSAAVASSSCSLLGIRVGDVEADREI